MPLVLKKKVAVLRGHCEIEDAESLFNWLQESSGRSLNLKELTSAHTAIYQVILGFQPTISIMPEDTSLFWLKELLTQDSKEVWL